MAVSSTRQELLPSLYIVEHQQLQALHKEFCQQLATPSSFNMLAELEAIQHKRDEAAQQNEAPVAGSVEGQSVPVKIETLVGKVV
eukprot:Em0012g269a